MKKVIAIQNFKGLEKVFIEKKTVFTPQTEERYNFLINNGLAKDYIGDSDNSEKHQVFTPVKDDLGFLIENNIGKNDGGAMSFNVETKNQNNEEVKNTEEKQKSQHDVKGGKRPGRPRKNKNSEQVETK